MTKLSELPFDIQYEIINYLPLSSRIIYQTQICKSLRIILQGKLTLHKPDSFELVEWRRASREVARLLQKDEQDKRQRTVDDISGVMKSNGLGVHHHLSAKKKSSIWDTSPSSTPKPAPASGFILPPLTLETLKTEDLKSVPFADHSDVDLFARCMRLLGKMDVQQEQEQRSPLPPLYLSTPSTIIPLKTLSLLSRTGFKVASLIYFLQTVPALNTIKTVLMTSAGSAEMILWSLFKPVAVKQTYHFQQSSNQLLSTNDDLGNCKETQAIVIPGPNAQRGKGLQSGFNCLCFFNDGGYQSSSDHTFHVIFHDWYDEAEAEGTQDMLQNSNITCNSCKQMIEF